MKMETKPKSPAGAVEWLLSLPFINEIIVGYIKTSKNIWSLFTSFYNTELRSL